MEALRPIRAAAAGYREARPAERGLFGVATSFAATVGTARTINYERWLSLPFGAGLALTTDELGLLVESSNPYWGSEDFALAQCAAASVALAAVFARRGLRTGAAAPTPSSGAS